MKVQSKTLRIFFLKHWRRMAGSERYWNADHQDEFLLKWSAWSCMPRRGSASFS